jgi:hypothetical protein
MRNAGLLMWAVLVIWTLTNPQPADAQIKRTPIDKAARSNVYGRWSDGTTGLEFLDDGTLGIFLDGGTKVSEAGTYKFISDTRVKLNFPARSDVWTIKSVTKSELVTKDLSGYERKFYRAIEVDPVVEQEARCLTIMTVIDGEEDYYKLKRGRYLPIRQGANMAVAGLLREHPSCPGGGLYSVSVTNDDVALVSCSKHGDRTSLDNKHEATKRRAQGTTPVMPKPPVLDKATAAAVRDGRLIATALAMYSNDNDDLLPKVNEDLGKLLAPYLKQDIGSMKGFRYMFSGGKLSTIKDSARTIVGYINRNPVKVTIFADGHVTHAKAGK